MNTLLPTVTPRLTSVLLLLLIDESGAGPIQPPMLGSAVGSARLHLSEEFPMLQAQLKARLDLCATTIQGTKLALATLQPSPIFQAQCDSPRIAFSVTERMRAKGFYACVCVFPAVPMNRPGIRFTITRHNELADIAPFVVALEESLDSATSALARGKHGSTAIQAAKPAASAL